MTNQKKHREYSTFELLTGQYDYDVLPERLGHYEIPKDEECNIMAYNILVINNYNQALDGLEIDEDSFIVIVNRCHQYDQIVLKQSFESSASHSWHDKRATVRAAIYESLMVNGVKIEQFEGLHSPIGVNIGGKIPEKIILNIVTELISERSK